jgi:hypothetical protein
MLFKQSNKESGTTFWTGRQKVGACENGVRLLRNGGVMASVTRGAARSTILALVLFTGVASRATAFEPPEVYVPELVATWEAQAAANRDNTGFALSVAFITWPSLFLHEMNNHPVAFKTWLDTLDRHTAKHTGEPGRGRWVIRQMKSLAVHWDGVRYRDMTESIRRTAAACTTAGHP